MMGIAGGGGTPFAHPKGNHKESRPGIAFFFCLSVFTCLSFSLALVLRSSEKNSNRSS